MGITKEEPTELADGKIVPSLKIYRYDNDLHPFSIGIGRARLIVENFQAINAFYEKNKNGNNGGKRQ